MLPHLCRDNAVNEGTRRSLPCCLTVSSATPDVVDDDPFPAHLLYFLDRVAGYQDSIAATMKGFRVYLSYPQQ